MQFCQKFFQVCFIFNNLLEPIRHHFLHDVRHPGILAVNLAIFFLVFRHALFHVNAAFVRQLEYQLTHCIISRRVRLSDVVYHFVVHRPHKTVRFQRKCNHAVLVISVSSMFLSVLLNGNLIHQSNLRTTNVSIEFRNRQLPSCCLHILADNQPTLSRQLVCPTDGVCNLRLSVLCPCHVCLIQHQLVRRRCVCRRLNFILRNACNPRTVIGVKCRRMVEVACLRRLSQIYLLPLCAVVFSAVFLQILCIAFRRLRLWENSPFRRRLFCRLLSHFLYFRHWLCCCLFFRYRGGLFRHGHSLFRRRHILFRRRHILFRLQGLFFLCQRLLRLCRSFSQYVSSGKPAPSGYAARNHAAAQCANPRAVANLSCRTLQCRRCRLSFCFPCRLRRHVDFRHLASVPHNQRICNLVCRFGCAFLQALSTHAFQNLRRQLSLIAGNLRQLAQFE